MRFRCGALGALSGGLYCLAFPDFGLWPLAFLTLGPLLLCVELAATTAQLLASALLAGTIAALGRGYFLLETLQNFAGLPLWACAAVTLVIGALQGGQFVVWAWLLRRAQDRGHPIGAWAPVVFGATELAYPRIFHDHLANALHDQTLVIQIADLGGPLLLSVAIVLATGALHELRFSLLRQRPPSRALLASATGAWLAIPIYGSYRIDEVEARMAAAEHRNVGLVQANAGMFDKYRERRKYYLRHYRSSQALEKEVDLDLLVWPETAVQRVRDSKRTHGSLTTPLLLGAIDRRDESGTQRKYNSVLLTDAEGATIGRYDKRHLLPFGEYLPLEERFPQLRTLSPRSGRFTAGTRHDALRVEGFRIAALVCYEDVVVGLVRDAVRRARPNLLVNLTNDAWFGDTNAARLHLSLAKFRAVEHHRALVRATNSGVSAVVDPLGRELVRGPMYARARLHAEVPLLDDDTPFGRFGEVPGAVCLIASLWLLSPRRRR